MSAHAAPRSWGIGLLCGTVLIAAGCDEVETPTQLRVAGGDPALGRIAVERHDCGVCHIVPGVRGARGTVGPSLAAFGLRAYVGGVAPNNPATLTRWVRAAPEIAPNTAMPSLPIDEAEARHIAAFLYTLR